MTERAAVDGVLDDDIEHLQEDSVTQTNITAAKAVSNAVRTTLGPRGSEKMLVDNLGEIHLTRDGMTIVDEMEIEHPPAALVAEVAESQHDAFGDGVTTALVLTGELLERASGLLEMGCHPRTVIRGYDAADRRATAIVDEMSTSVADDDLSTLPAVARTALSGNIADDTDALIDCIVQAARSVPDRKPVEHVKIKSVVESGDSEFVEGTVFEKEPVHPDMPTRVEDARIAITDTHIEPRSSDQVDKITPGAPGTVAEFDEREQLEGKQIVSDMLAADPDVVVCQEGIDDRIGAQLEQAGVLAVQYLVDRNVQRLAKSTGATVVGDVRELSTDDLGYAEVVEQDIVEGFDYVFFRGCENPQSVSFVVRGVAEQQKDEVKRGILDAFNAVRSVVEQGTVVPGGGAVETELALRLAENAQRLDSRDQLAAEAFADALNVIPRTLGRNLGADPADAVTTLRSRHANGVSAAGLATDGSVADDMIQHGVVEPSETKKGAIATAAAAAMHILRIDDIFMAPISNGDSPGP